MSNFDNQYSYKGKVELKDNPPAVEKSPVEDEKVFFKEKPLEENQVLPELVEKVVKKVVKAPVKVAVEDRSAFNCPDCKGLGLAEDSNYLCRKCAGTGKV